MSGVVVRDEGDSVNIRPFCVSDEPAVIALWQECGLTRPWNDPHRDIIRKLAVQAHMFLVGESDGRVVGSVMAGYEGHRGWINYLAVSPAYQGRGYGRLLMERAEQLLSEAGCPKINLQVRSTNTEVIAFYDTLGYSVDDVVSMGKRLVNDHEPSGSRSPDPLPPALDPGIREHRLIVRQIAEHGNLLSPCQWKAPREHGKWSPAQEVAHLTLVYRAFGDTLSGGPPRSLRVPAERAVELQRTVLPAILDGKEFPTGARAPEETAPPEVPGAPNAVIAAFQTAAGAFETALLCAYKNSPHTRAVHPYFGPLALPDLLALLTAHARHHVAYLPPLASPR